MYYESAQETKQFINEPYSEYDDTPHNRAWFIYRIIRTHIRSVIEMYLTYGKSIQYTSIDNSDKFMYSIDDQYKNKIQTNCIDGNIIHTMYNNYDGYVSELIKTLCDDFPHIYNICIPDDITNELTYAGYRVIYSDNRKTISIGFRE
jgi:hypothetical protein